MQSVYTWSQRCIQMLNEDSTITVQIFHCSSAFSLPSVPSCSYFCLYSTIYHVYPLTMPYWSSLPSLSSPPISLLSFIPPLSSTIFISSHTPFSSLSACSTCFWLRIAMLSWGTSSQPLWPASATTSRELITLHSQLQYSCCGRS